MTKFNTATPYIACFAILRKDGKAAFVKRAHTGWMDGYYGLPAGKVEWNESYIQAAVREAKEEVGVTIKPEHVHLALTVHRHSDDTDWIDIYFNVDEWQGEITNVEPDVHSEAIWLDPTTASNDIVPHQQFALTEISLGHSYAEYGWENP